MWTEPCTDCGQETDSLVGDVYWCDSCLNTSLEEYELTKQREWELDFAD